MLVSGADTLEVKPRLEVLVSSKKVLSEGDLTAMKEWLRVRLDDSTVVVAPLPTVF